MAVFQDLESTLERLGKPREVLRILLSQGGPWGGWADLVARGSRKDSRGGEDDEASKAFERDWIHAQLASTVSLAERYRPLFTPTISSLEISPYGVSSKGLAWMIFVHGMRRHYREELTPVRTSAPTLAKGWFAGLLELLTRFFRGRRPGMEAPRPRRAQGWSSDSERSAFSAKYALTRKDPPGDFLALHQACADAVDFFRERGDNPRFGIPARPDEKPLAAREPAIRAGGLRMHAVQEAIPHLADMEARGHVMATDILFLLSQSPLTQALHMDILPVFSKSLRALPAFHRFGRSGEAQAEWYAAFSSWTARALTQAFVSVPAYAWKPKRAPSYLHSIPEVHRMGVLAAATFRLGRTVHLHFCNMVVRMELGEMEEALARELKEGRRAAEGSSTGSGTPSRWILLGPGSAIHKRFMRHVTGLDFRDPEAGAPLLAALAQDKAAAGILRKTLSWLFHRGPERRLQGEENPGSLEKELGILEERLWERKFAMPLPFADPDGDGKPPGDTLMEWAEELQLAFPRVQATTT